MFATLLDIVLPQPCLGCGAPRARLCPACLAAAATPARRMPDPSPAGLPPCWSAAPYAGAVRDAVLAYKERGEAALAAPLADLLAFTLVTALKTAQEGAERLLGRDPEVLVVPIPSSRQAVNGRGHDHVRELATRAVRRLRARGMPAALWPALRQRRGTADQSGLGSAGRVANLAGSFSVPDSAVRLLAGARPPGRGARTCGEILVVVDDVVTTGATLADATRALKEVGAQTPLAVTVAATRRASRNGYGDSQ